MSARVAPRGRARMSVVSRARLTVAALVGATLCCGCGIGVVGALESAPGGGADAAPDVAGPAEGAAPVDAAPADAASADAGPCSDPSLVLCMRFEDSLVDEAKAQTVRVTGAVAYATGIHGKALVIDPSDELLIDDNAAWTYSALTVEVWVRPDVIPASARAGVFDKNNSFGVFLYPASLVTCVLGATVSANIGGAGEWVHLACTSDGTTTRLYVDGVERTSAPSVAIGMTSEVASIGGNSPSGDRLSGALDTLRVYGRARSSSEISAAARR